MHDPYMRRVVQDLYRCRAVPARERDALLEALVEAVEAEEHRRSYDTLGFFARYRLSHPAFAALADARLAEREAEGLAD